MQGPYDSRGKKVNEVRTYNVFGSHKYLIIENRGLSPIYETPLRLTDAERMTLAGIAHRLGRKALEDVANVVKPDTLMG